MSEINFLTTRTREWSRRMPPLPQWTDHGNGFYVKFNEYEKLPLELLDYIGHITQGGVVEKRRCTMNGSLVAVKKLDTYREDKINTELHTEVEILRSLKHYHCIRTLGCYTQGDSFSIVTEPVAVCDLDTYLSKPSSVKAEKMEKVCGSRDSFLPKIMGCLAHGLQYIHKEPRARPWSDEEKMVRHRDISLGNILLDGRRVLYADFGHSKFFTETRTGSSGTSHGHTNMYTSPQRKAKQHRNSSDDIFSLACVFAEIFNVYKGKTIDEFLAQRIRADPDKRGWFHKAEVMTAVLEWLDGLATERCDVQIIRLLRAMLSFRPDRRPNAEQVWKTLTTCTNNVPLGNNYFCGPCCMPLLREDPLLKADPGVPPSETKYASSLSLLDRKPVSRDLSFKTKFDKDEQVNVDWKRNLRHWDHSILDAVQSGTHPDLLARKRITSSGHDGGSCKAKNEAEILSQVKHPNIVKLHGTYQQGNVFTLLFEPAADHDLRSYLEIAELQIKQNRLADEDFEFMTRSFECLADALACVHAAGYDHGDISPENILVHHRRIYLSKFSFGLRLNIQAKGGGPSNHRHHRFRNAFGNLSLRGRGDGQPPTDSERQQRQQPGTYQPPEWLPTSVGQTEADIFALGCVFAEIYSVLCGRRVRDFEKFRADDEGEAAYHRTLPKTVVWLSTIDNKEHKDKEKFLGVIRSMIETDASKRPHAAEIGRIVEECKTSGGLIFNRNRDQVI